MTLPALDAADIDYAVRALMALPRCHWDAAADVMVRAAALAEDLRQSGRRAHPVLGNGALSSTVSRWPMSQKSGMDGRAQAEALEALATAIIQFGDEQAVLRP